MGNDLFHNYSSVICYRGFFSSLSTLSTSPFEYSSLLYFLATSYRHSGLINGFKNISLSLGTLLSLFYWQHNLDINAKSEFYRKPLKKLLKSYILFVYKHASTTSYKHWNTSTNLTDNNSKIAEMLVLKNEMSCLLGK